MPQIFVNNGRARLAVAVSAGATTIDLTGIVGLPTSLASGDWFLLSLSRDDSRYGSNHEVVKVTDILGITYTVVRGYEGAAVAHDAAELVEARSTADTHTRMLREAVWAHISDKPAAASRWPAWDEVTAKPGAFTPVAHTHPWAEVTGAPATATRWPSWSEVTSKPLTTDSRTDASTTTLLQAKAMNDHRTSGDHDARYALKSGGANANFTTMPQVGGAPIVESGSNSDGEWTRWADGTQICGSELPTSPATGWTATATHSFVNAGTKPFPVPFIGTVFMGVVGQDGQVSARAAYVTHVSRGPQGITGCWYVTPKNESTFAHGVGGAYTATGRWK